MSLKSVASFGGRETPIVRVQAQVVCIDECVCVYIAERIRVEWSGGVYLLQPYYCERPRR